MGSEVLVITQLPSRGVEKKNGAVRISIGMSSIPLHTLFPAFDLPLMRRLLLLVVLRAMWYGYHCTDLGIESSQRPYAIILGLKGLRMTWVRGKQAKNEIEGEKENKSHNVKLTGISCCTQQVTPL